MQRISPVWILTSLSGEAFNKFKAAIDQQFKTFSENELIGFENCGQHQWWGVESTDGGLAEKWSPEYGYPNNIPAYQNLGLYDGLQGIVIYYSPLQEFTINSQYIIDLKENPLFFQTYGGNKFFYGLTSFHKKEIANPNFINYIRTIEQNETNYHNFNSVTFLSDSSHNAGNQNGYLNLNEDDFLSLVVNTIFTIAITKQTLHLLNNGQNRFFNTVGVFSFTYEPDALKHSKAYNLAEELLSLFCNNEADPNWFSDNDARMHFEGSSLKQNLHWYNIYKLLSQGFEEESMKGLWPHCEISPWQMLAYKLVPLYFKKYVKSLLRKVYNNVHNFASITQMRYETFAKKRRQQILDGTADIENRQQFAKTAIAAYVCSIWDASYKGAKGIQQVLLLLEKTKDYLEKQKKEVNRVKAFEEPNDDQHKGFPKVEDYPLQEIFKKGNEKYKQHYVEFVTNGEPPTDYTEEADKSYEERQLSMLQKLLQWHPVPLNLFTKAGLLSVLIFVSIWALISIIQATNMVRIFSLETDHSLIALFVIIAVIVLVFAFVKYGFKTLRKIRLALEKYIAWSYYKVQRDVYGISLEEEKHYYDALIKECDRITNRLDIFVKSALKEKPSFERYKISKFQRNILDKMDDKSQILDEVALNVTVSINNEEYSPDKVVPGLFDAMLRESRQKLNEKMQDCLFEESDSDTNVKEKLLKLWTDILADNIKIAIFGHYGNSIDFPAFHNTPTSNFTNEAWLLANAIIYPSVYVYAMRPYSCVISIVPNGDGYVNGVRWEQLFYGPDQVNQKEPNFAGVQNPIGWLTTRQIAIIMRVHAFNMLIVNRNNVETTIFNN